jgi:transposase
MIERLREERALGKLLKLAAPSSSPDLDLIENAFAWLKAHVRKSDARTLDTLERPAANALQLQT